MDQPLWQHNRHTQTHTHTHTHTHKHTHIHTHTHTNTHTQHRRDRPLGQRNRGCGAQGLMHGAGFPRHYDPGALFWLTRHISSCKRDLFPCQKRPISIPKETYLYGKRDLFTWQKRQKININRSLLPLPHTSGMLVLVGLFCLITGLFWHFRIPQVRSY